VKSTIKIYKSKLHNFRSKSNKNEEFKTSVNKKMP